MIDEADDDCHTTSDSPPEFSKSEELSEETTSASDDKTSLILHKHQIKMQRLAKKRRLFLIQKLSRRIKVLKAKKGNDQQLSKNARKSERLVQKINDMKLFNLEAIILEMIENNFTKPSETETTINWFKCELLQDKFSFMAFVNPLIGLPAEIAQKSQAKQKKMPPKQNVGHNDQDLFINSLSSYNEKEDTVLNEILTTKKNRPGQRARQKQWEELYGTEAKHLGRSKLSKPDTKTNRQLKENKRKRKELPPQEIVKKLKTKDSEKKEHPSWVAKKQQSSLSTKIDIFAGTKTTFSDDD